MITSRRDRRRFQPAFDALDLRIAPSGLTELPDSRYLEPTGPCDRTTVEVGNTSGSYLQATGPVESC